MRLRRPRLATAVLGLAVAGAFAWPSTAPAQGADPSVRLISPGGSATLYGNGKRVWLLDLPLWVAAAGGDFELRASRPDYDTPVGIAQVDAVNGDVLRDLPDDTLDGWSGLSGFLEVTVSDSAGNQVAQRSFTFCPNAWERQRVDDSGPELSRYPTVCGDWLSFFTKGMVWGIDSGWASPAFAWTDSGIASLRIPAGEYTMVVRIASSYAELLEVPEEDAAVTLEVTVVDGRGARYPAPASTQRSTRPVQDLGVPDVIDPDPSTLPDLVALPLWSMRAFSRNGRDYLGFAATPWNAGPAPMVVEGFRRFGEARMDAYQYFRDADGTVVGRAPVGEMAWDARRGHNHWHFLQFASFTLRDAVQMELVRSRKQAFCLAPTNAIDLTVEGAMWNPYGDGVHTACGSENALWVREALQAGWADTYFQGIPGQSFNITKLPNGWYYARLEVNPLGALYETTTANNAESRLIYLGGRPGRRTVLVSPWHGIPY
jgi:hypothetical protein